MKQFVHIVVLMTCLVTISGCGRTAYQSPAAQYIERSDTITMDAGNAQAVNSINSIVDPWPPYAGDRRIPANGERMVGAIVRYRAPTTTQRSGGQPGQATPPASTSSPPASASDGTLPF